MTNLLQDLRYALRMLAKNPGFTAVAVITLALGIGANTAIFSVVDAVLLRPLPYPQSEQLVQLANQWGMFPGYGYVSFPEFLEIRKQTTSLDAAALYRGRSFNWSQDARAERLQAVEASVDIFRVLGVKPQVGRVFTAEEAHSGHAQVVVLSHGLWQRWFAGASDVGGQQLRLNGENYSVIGVMPRGFYFPDKTRDAWVPIDEDRAEKDEGPLAHIRQGVALLKPGATLQQARAELSAVAALLREKFPNHFPAQSGFNMVALNYQERVVGDTRTPLLVLLGAVAFVLLIACANVASLFLARASARERELAIRSALGAARSSLLRQLLVESFLLAALGAAAGLLVAWWGVDLLANLPGTNVPRLEEAHIDGRVLAFTFGLTMLTGLLFGLMPAWRVTRAELIPALQDSSRGSSGMRHRRFRNALVISEVALSVVLLAGTALLLRSYLRIMQVEPGFDPKGVLAANVSLGSALYPTPERRIAFFEQLLERLRNEPGVAAAAAISDLPLLSTSDILFQIEGRPIPKGQQMPDEQHRIVAGDFFSTMGIPLLRGRNFDSRDQRGKPEVVIVNQALEKKYWPTGNALGARIAFGNPNETPWVTVIGVVADVRDDRLERLPQPTLYCPHSQYAYGGMTLVVRGANGATPPEELLRRSVASVDPELAVSGVQPMDLVVSSSVASQRLNLMLITVFAVQALALAAVGLYGVMSYVVQQQTRETGIRIAFGASPREVLKLYMRRGFLLVGTGLAAGLVVAFPIARGLKALLYEVQPGDTASYVGISLLLASVAALACWIPARRAARVDPIVALRHE